MPVYMGGCRRTTDLSPAAVRRGGQEGEAELQETEQRLRSHQSVFHKTWPGLAWPGLNVVVSHQLIPCASDQGLLKPLVITFGLV